MSVATIVKRYFEDEATFRAKTADYAPLFLTLLGECDALSIAASELFLDGKWDILKDTLRHLPSDGTRGARITALLRARATPRDFAALFIAASELDLFEFDIWQPRLIVVQASSAHARDSTAACMRRAGYIYGFARGEALFYLPRAESLPRLLSAARSA